MHGLFLELSPPVSAEGFRPNNSMPLLRCALNPASSSANARISRKAIRLRPSHAMLQIAASADLLAAAAAGSSAIAALLKGAPRSQLVKLARGIRELLHSFLLLFDLAECVHHIPNAAPLVERFFQREWSTALAATVGALQALPTTQSEQLEDRWRMHKAVRLVMALAGPGNEAGRVYAAWPDVAGAESLQQYAMETLAAAAAAAAASSQSPQVAQGANPVPPVGFQNPARQFLLSAVVTGRINEARLREILTHAAILAPLQAASEGRADFDGAELPVEMLREAGKRFTAQRYNLRGHSEGDVEALRRAQSAMMGALRQGLALLQLRTVAPEMQKRAVRRATADGFLQVPSSSELGQNARERFDCQ